MALIVGINSWVSVEDANLYFADRLGASTHWNTTASKSAALVTAFKQLMGCGLFSLAATDTAQAIKDAQCEMALFLLIHQEDMDSRAGLQAQGVAKAGIVQEEYDLAAAGKPMIPANVKALLKDYETEDSAGLYISNATRDDDKDAQL
jgi:hypothetical protein